MKIKALLCFCCSFLISFGAFAENMPIPVKIQTALFLKILSYDKSINNNIKIGILNGDNKSEIEESFKEVSSQKIGAFSFSVVSIPDINSIKNIDVLYVTPDNKSKISQINKITKDLGILTLTGVPEYVENHGLSVAIELKDGKPKILINLNSFKKENRDFSSQLLKLCRIT